MKDMDSLLIVRGHVIDPASGIDQEMDVLLRDGRVAAVAAAGKASRSGQAQLQRQGLHRRSRLHRSARAPARARTGPQGDHRHRNRGGSGGRIYLRLRHAQHRPGQRLGGDHALDARSGTRRAGECFSHRSGDRRQSGREAYEFCRAQAGGSGCCERRRQADSRRPADARMRFAPPPG